MTDDGLDVELVDNPEPKQPTENRWLEAFHAIDDERAEDILYCQVQTKYLFECMQRFMKIRNAYLACILIGSAICAGGFGYYFYRIYDQTMIVRSCSESEWSEWKVVPLRPLSEDKAEQMECFKEPFYYKSMERSDKLNILVPSTYE